MCIVLFDINIQIINAFSQLVLRITQQVQTLHQWQVSDISCVCREVFGALGCGNLFMVDHAIMCWKFSHFGLDQGVAFPIKINTYETDQQQQTSNLSIYDESSSSMCMSCNQFFLIFLLHEIILNVLYFQWYVQMYAIPYLVPLTNIAMTGASQSLMHPFLSKTCY